MGQIFEVVISSCENSTWQGTLRIGEKLVPFQSELELLLAMARHLPPEGLEYLGAKQSVWPGPRETRPDC